MNDRELLEMAAKAAGLELDWDVPGGADPWVMTGDGVDRGPGAPWNPSEDDGDAFRLAVKCDIAFGRSANTWWARWEFNDKVFRENAETEGAQDHGAAARRAILRVAADIGKYHVKS
jgi:hypothetical protein